MPHHHIGTGFATAGIGRRRLLGVLTTMALAPSALHASGMAKLGTEVLGAPTTATIMLARLLQSGALTGALPSAEFRTWHDPDELRAGIVSGRTRLFTAPSHVPANLANRGMPVKLLAILSMGHLSIVTSDPAIMQLSDLRGRKVLGFFRHDMPDLVFRVTAQMEGLDPDRDLQLTYVASPMEAAQMLAAGRAEIAILSEPSATGAIMMAEKQGRHLRRAVNLQSVWLKHKGGQGIPMVSVGVHTDLLKEAPELVAVLRKGLPEARNWVAANPAEAAALAEKTMHMPQPVFRQSLDHAALVTVSAKDAQKGLEEFYRTLLQSSPATLNGRLPSDDFYLAL